MGRKKEVAAERQETPNSMDGCFRCCEHLTVCNPCLSVVLQATGRLHMFGTSSAVRKVRLVVFCPPVEKNAKMDDNGTDELAILIDNVSM